MANHKNELIQEWVSSAVKCLAEQATNAKVCHQHRVGEPLPSTEKLKATVEKIRQIIFPGYFGEINLHPAAFPYYMGVLVDEVFEVLSEQILAGLCFICESDDPGEHVKRKQKAEIYAADFISGLPELRRVLITDVDAAYLGDPAANNFGEVIFCYPAIRAISSYRIAHALFKLGVPLIPRIVTEMAHSETGIDINPEAEIGEYFTIDHGTGVVIGSTCIIGNNVKLYQGVTLGAKSFPTDLEGRAIKGLPRHPIVEDDVVIYSGATVLGRVTIGRGSVLGGSVWVTEDVPPNTIVSQARLRSVDQPAELRTA